MLNGAVMSPKAAVSTILCAYGKGGLAKREAPSQRMILYRPQIRNCCDKMPVWLIPIILLSLAVMMVSYFS